MNKIIINNKTNIKLNKKEISLLKLAIENLIKKISVKPKTEPKTKNLNKWKTQKWSLYR
tara:strand:+ start:3332 stop:3508 length:177 start_codon:yes stop_codon:yes gene_type:complete